jgi:hypothetical protein
MVGLWLVSSLFPSHGPLALAGAARGYVTEVANQVFRCWATSLCTKHATARPEAPVVLASKKGRRSSDRRDEDNGPGTTARPSYARGCGPMYLHLQFSELKPSMPGPPPPPPMAEPLNLGFTLGVHLVAIELRKVGSRQPEKPNATTFYACTGVDPGGGPVWLIVYRTHSAPKPGARDNHISDNHISDDHINDDHISDRGLADRVSHSLRSNTRRRGWTRLHDQFTQSVGPGLVSLPITGAARTRAAGPDR